MNKEFFSIEEVNQYHEKGFIIKKKFFSINECKLINLVLDKLPPKVFVPYSKNVAWGYGNLLDNKNINNIYPIENLFENIKPLINHKNLICNHLMAVNKAAFIGPDVEWHQEFFNINTYAPGYSPELDLNNFLQIFIALDNHTSKNGPLIVFEGSHKEGLLEHEDIINMNIGHKRRLTYKTLENISKKRKQIELLLKPGDAVFFNHLVVHGSPTNTSPYRRRALLYQIRNDCKTKDSANYEQEVKYRSKFIVDKCKNIIDKLQKNNPYSEFKK